MSEYFHGSTTPVSVFDGLTIDPSLDLSLSAQSAKSRPPVFQSMMAVRITESSQALVDFYMELTPHRIVIKTRPDRQVCGVIAVDYCRVKAQFDVSWNFKVMHKIDLFTTKSSTSIFTEDRALALQWMSHLRKFTIGSDFKGQFEQETKLGEGSFGAVYSIKEKCTGKRYAVKKLPRAKLVENSEEARFALNEIQLLSITELRNCISLVAVYEDEESLYIVTNLFTGIDLLLTVVMENRLSVQRSVRYCQQLLQVLVALELQGIVHHDIKPQNLVFSDSTANAELCLVDFGFAFQMKDEKLCTLQWGTRTYAAPEVLAGLPHSTKADVYSAGVILCFMLTGELYHEIIAKAAEEYPDKNLQNEIHVELVLRDKFPDIPALSKLSLTQ